ncbi:hypothetical protein O7631_27120 [Micromonospora sp. WMMD967]|uniref:hypothetical protein n=1 Tax=Micromonospora sp. WMMD967 TaxID=3016101 RepID=UPI002416B97D|nr:hypothetical protein [Micromonospora sp. WMMD967]MDG4840219.1 hypothetical protein [Micromonospora sp. WMMD967]
MHAASRLSGLPELAQVRKVWFSDWYDGPITGVAAHDGREYWFVMVTNDAAGETWDFNPRVYALHLLSSEQLAQAWNMHRAFASAGLPGCLHLPRCASAGATVDELDALRERWPAEFEVGLMNTPAIAWFQDG